MFERHEALREQLQTIHRLDGVMAVLGWDQEVVMPTGGARTRGHHRGALASVIHEKVTAPELGERLDAAAADPQADPALLANVRVARRRRDRAVKLPASLVRELAEATATAHPDWVAARRDDDWARFAPHLTRLVDLKRREAAALGIGDEPYDALLDEYEPDARTAEIVPVFTALRESLVDLLGRLGPDAGHDVPLGKGPFSLARQEILNRRALEAIGYDFACGRLDVSAHPFTESPGPGDVRVTTRYDENDILSGLTSTLHEGGHALYELGLPAELAELPAGQALSLGIHESQSRMWENAVGRGLPFCRWLCGVMREVFDGQLDGLQPETLQRALTVVRPSPIRVEADEVTYNLHIILRLEIERALVAGDLETADVPAVWREKARDLLGLELADDRTGPLQDIHWTMGAIGYFPTYTLGNLYAAMFWNAARADVPDLDDRLAAGDGQPLLGWARRKIHARASLVTAAELCREVTGRDLCADDFVAYLNDRYGARP
jgi:carboxypeptidase Taq